MENPNTIEEFEDAISLCDFAVYDGDQENSDSGDIDQLQSCSITSQEGDEEDCPSEFEFSKSSSSSETTDSVKDGIIFCGKFISCKSENDDNDHDGGCSGRGGGRYDGPLLFSSSSPSDNLMNKIKIGPNNSSSKPVLPRQARRSSSKKDKVFIGLAKIPSKMEISDLRERQNRKLISTPTPAVVGGEATLGVSGDGSRKRNHNWDLLRLFRFRAQDIGRTLRRSSSSSISCLRLARPCID